MSEIPCEAHLIVNANPNNLLCAKAFENHKFMISSYWHFKDYWNMYINMKTVHKTVQHLAMSQDK